MRPYRSNQITLSSTNSANIQFRGQSGALFDSEDEQYRNAQEMKGSPYQPNSDNSQSMANKLLLVISYVLLRYIWRNCFVLSHVPCRVGTYNCKRGIFLMLWILSNQRKINWFFLLLVFFDTISFHSQLSLSVNVYPVLFTSFLSQNITNSISTYVYSSFRPLSWEIRKLVQNFWPREIKHRRFFFCFRIDLPF